MHVASLHLRGVHTIHAHAHAHVLCHAIDLSTLAMSCWRVSSRSASMDMPRQPCSWIAALVLDASITASTLGSASMPEAHTSCARSPCAPSSMSAPGVCFLSAAPSVADEEPTPWNVQPSARRSALLGCGAAGGGIMRRRGRSRANVLCVAGAIERTKPENTAYPSLKVSYKVNRGGDATESQVERRELLALRGHRRHRRVGDLGAVP